MSARALPDNVAHQFSWSFDPHIDPCSIGILTAMQLVSQSLRFLVELMICCSIELTSSQLGLALGCLMPLGTVIVNFKP